jgi:hypothetical protein
MPQKRVAFLGAEICRGPWEPPVGGKVADRGPRPVWATLPAEARWGRDSWRGGSAPMRIRAATRDGLAADLGLPGPATVWAMGHTTAGVVCDLVRGGLEGARCNSGCNNGCATR